MQEEKYVPVYEWANRVGMDRSHARKWLLQQGYSFVKLRDPKSRQMVIALTVEDAEVATDHRLSAGFFSEEQKPIGNGWGYFYIVQIMPDVIPNRVKFGYATNCKARLSAYLTISPTAQILETWPCAVTWEAAAIASLTRCECKLIGGEVYECEDLDALAARGHEFFALMPKEAA